ncbi:MAG: hypothetical protein M3Q47_06425, partial [Actinomycetota bacterium]|nr:hypothetical protein [Actinomycetota bacterium]
RIVLGAIRQTWLAAGGTSGFMGFPTTSEARTADGRGAFSRFQGGDVYWSPTTGARVVAGAVARTYWEQGGSSSTLGFPTRSTYSVPGGTRTDFQHGSLTWNAASGAVTVSR